MAGLCRARIASNSSNLERFIQLWTHRYHKYTHIFSAYLKGILSTIYFGFVKLRIGKRKLIAVIRTEHFGDIVAAEPISRLIRARYPDAYVVWFVKPAFKELVKLNPSIDEVHQEFCVTERQVIRRSGVFDEFFELQFKNNNHCPKCQKFTENPLALERGIDVFTYFSFGNLLEVFAKTGGLIGVHDAFPADDHPKLFLQDAHRRRADGLGLPAKFIAIHCQSNYAPKDWPQDRWKQLVNWLVETYPYDVVEIGLKSNLDIQSPRYHNLCGKLSIMETAEVIRRAAYFIGLDSGPSHLANATGTYGMVLMGALNNFLSYNPYAGDFGGLKNATLIRKDNLPCAEMDFAFVRERVEAVLQSRK